MSMDGTLAATMAACGRHNNIIIACHLNIWSDDYTQKDSHVADFIIDLTFLTEVMIDARNQN